MIQSPGEDLLTMRADRGRYYFGMAALQQRFIDCIRLIGLVA